MARSPVSPAKLTKAKVFQSVPNLLTIKRYEHDLIVRDGDYSYMIEDVSLTTWEKYYMITSFLLSNMGKILTIVYWFVRLIMVINMAETKDRKTTIAAIVKIVVAVIGVLGVVIPADVSEALIVAAVAIWAIVDFIQGIFTKDKDDNPKEGK